MAWCRQNKMLFRNRWVVLSLIDVIVAARPQACQCSRSAVWFPPQCHQPWCPEQNLLAFSKSKSWLQVQFQVPVYNWKSLSMCSKNSKFQGNGGGEASRKTKRDSSVLSSTIQQDCLDGGNVLSLHPSVWQSPTTCGCWAFNVTAVTDFFIVLYLI